MADNLRFGDRTAKRLDVLYRAADILRRRELVKAALDPRPGNSILDLGCGPGFYVSEIAPHVGSSGRVTGVDPSESMLALAGKRNEANDNVELRRGHANAIPADDGSFDAALSVQVLEYVEDISGAVAELHRVLRPGGRLVVWDVDWTTLSWRSSDDDRMARMLEAWNGHLHDPALPRTLATVMRSAGFRDVETTGHVFVNTDAGPETYSGNLIDVVSDYVEGSVDADDLAAWSSDLRALSDAGDYFFSITQFRFTATKPN